MLKQTKNGLQPQIVYFLTRHIKALIPLLKLRINLIPKSNNTHSLHPSHILTIIGN